MEALRGGVERLAEQVAKGRAESEAQAAELLDELAAVREIAEQRRAPASDELREELAAVRTQAELANAVAEKAEQPPAESAKLDDERVEALQAEVQFALSTMDEMKAGPHLRRPGRARRAPRGRAGQEGRRRRRRRHRRARHAGLPGDPRARREGPPAGPPEGRGRGAAGAARAPSRLRRREPSRWPSSGSTASSRNSIRHSVGSWGIRNTSSRRRRGRLRMTGSTTPSSRSSSPS